MSPSELAARLTTDDKAVLVRYAIGDQTPSQAILSAFTETELDMTDTSRPLHDSVDADAVDGLLDGEDGAVQFSVVLWDYPVLVFDETVYIFDPSSFDEG